MTFLMERMIHSALPFCGDMYGHDIRSCAIRQEEDPGGRVVKLTPVVALDGFDLPVELIRHISKEIGQSGECVKFKL
jgi:hypothetical protein